MSKQLVDMGRENSFVFNIKPNPNPMRIEMEIHPPHGPGFDFKFCSRFIRPNPWNESLSQAQVCTESLSYKSNNEMDYSIELRKNNIIQFRAALSCKIDEKLDYLGIDAHMEELKEIEDIVEKFSRD